jgi:hypothetical protein
MVRGLIVGIIVSAMIWILGFMLNNETVFVIALVAAGAKYLAAIVMLFIREWRMFGVGLFVSLPIGAVIFFGVCTTAMVTHG